jgi:hypothetical protein
LLKDKIYNRFFLYLLASREQQGKEPKVEEKKGRFTLKRSKSRKKQAEHNPEISDPLGYIPPASLANANPPHGQHTPVRTLSILFSSFLLLPFVPMASTAFSFSRPSASLRCWPVDVVVCVGIA